MNLTDPNRLSSILTFLMHCDAQHPATIERIDATTHEGIDNDLKKTRYENAIMEVEIAVTKLYNRVMSEQIASLKMQEELEAERAALKLVNEAFKK